MRGAVARSMLFMTTLAATTTRRFFTASAWSVPPACAVRRSRHTNSLVQWCASTSSFRQPRNHVSKCQRTNLISCCFLSSSSASSYGQGMNQEAMMETDRLIAVDEHDRVIIPSSSHYLSKKQGHLFSADTPRGILHRAFSFFLFDDQNRMLLTQRASTKITFPNVWTNTCCSHPLHGMIPNEVDEDPSQSYPVYDGIKHAARRKLQHELGIHPSCIVQSDIVFLKRFHYWAADTITYGAKVPPWGEHEIDYILFYKCQSNNTPTITANPDEVSNYEYVTASELRHMMDTPGLLWSPWFRGIMDRGGWDWWDDLSGSLNGRYTSDEIVYFDPPREHYASYNLNTHDRNTGVWTIPTATQSSATASASSSSSRSSSA